MRTRIMRCSSCGEKRAFRYVRGESPGSGAEFLPARILMAVATAGTSEIIREAWYECPYCGCVRKA